MIRRAASSPAVGVDEVLDALRLVDDPEYPGLSIVDLGLVENVRLTPEVVEVDLVPTFTGCPALGMIRSDVETAVRGAAGRPAHIRFVNTPVWTPERITDHGHAVLADRFTVGVSIRGRSTPCPQCGEPTTEEHPFGPTRCRAIHRCAACGERVEVIR